MKLTCSATVLFVCDGLNRKVPTCMMLGQQIETRFAWDQNYFASVPKNKLCEKLKSTKLNTIP
jgi:hypothetical protein